MGKGTRGKDVFGQNVIRDSSGKTYTEGTDAFGDSIVRGPHGETFTKSTDAFGNQIWRGPSGEVYTHGVDAFGQSIIRGPQGEVYTEGTDLFGNDTIRGQRPGQGVGASGGTEDGIAALIGLGLAAIVIIPLCIYMFAELAGRIGQLACAFQFALCIIVGIIAKIMPRRINAFCAVVGNFIVSVASPLALYYAVVVGRGSMALGAVLLSMIAEVIGMTILCILESKAFNDHLYSSYNRVVLIIGIFVSGITVSMIPYSDFYRNPLPYTIFFIPQILLLIDVIVKFVDFIRRK